MKNTVLLFALLFLFGDMILANKSESVEVDPVDSIIEQSQQTMRQAAKVSEMADKVVVAQVQEMKETIEVLEDEKQDLVQQIKVMYNEIHTIKSAPMQPFDVLAILPDSTGRGE